MTKLNTNRTLCPSVAALNVVERPLNEFLFSPASLYSSLLNFPVERLEA